MSHEETVGWAVRKEQEKVWLRCTSSVNNYYMFTIYVGCSRKRIVHLDLDEWRIVPVIENEKTPLC